MFFRIVLCLALAALTACSTVSMAMFPGLQSDSVSYKITEMPGAFSGGDLLFGPYRANRVSRSVIKNSG